MTRVSGYQNREEYLRNKELVMGQIMSYLFRDEESNKNIDGKKDRTVSEALEILEKVYILLRKIDKPYQCDSVVSEKEKRLDNALRTTDFYELAKITMEEQDEN